MLMKNNAQAPRILPATLKVNIADVIRYLIFEGTLVGGSEINQVALARQLGVSRGPLREALAMLENEDLISSVPYKSGFVTLLTHVYVQEIFSVRTALEVLGLEKYIGNLSSSDMDVLENIITKMRAAAQVGDVAKFSELDLEFHKYLIISSNHLLLGKLWLVIESGLKRCIWSRHKIYPSLNDGIGSHPDILIALRQQDLARSTLLLVQHIQESLSNILANLPVGESPNGMLKG